MAVAVRVVMPEVPLILRIALVPWVNPPVPERAVVTVKPLLEVTLLVRVTVGTVTLPMVRALPPMAWAFVSKVYTPLPAVKVVPL